MSVLPYGSHVVWNALRWRGRKCLCILCVSLIKNRITLSPAILPVRAVVAFVEGPMANVIVGIVGVFMRTPYMIRFSPVGLAVTLVMSHSAVQCHRRSAGGNLLVVIASASALRWLDHIHHTLHFCGLSLVRYLRHSGTWFRWWAFNYLQIVRCP